VHTAISKRVFGISEAVCEEVNRLVDKKDVHDLGRRMPKGPRPFEKFLYPDVASERLMQVKRAWKALLSVTSKSVEHAYAFYLHHALDLLAPRLIAIRATGLPLERVADNIRKAVCGELWVVGNRLGRPPKLTDFFEDFKSRFAQVVDDPDLASWADGAYERRLEFERAVGFEDHLVQRVRKALPKRTAQEQDEEAVFQLSCRASYEEVAAIMHKAMKGVKSEDWAYYYSMGLVSLLSFWRSRLADYAILTAWPRDVISEIFVKTTRKRYSSLGRLALDACERSAQSSHVWSKDEAISRIVEEAEKKAEHWLGYYGVVPPQNCFEDYARLFVTGFEIVVFKLGVKREGPPSVI
jgi:hypothetical protein